jgi:hypothetical protein
MPPSRVHRAWFRQSAQYGTFVARVLRMPTAAYLVAIRAAIAKRFRSSFRISRVPEDGDIQHAHRLGYITLSPGILTSFIGSSSNPGQGVEWCGGDTATRST